jgi:DNA-binding transcriptional regulator YiaG
MTAIQFRNALRRLDLTQQEAARLLGADERTARRWALGERAVPSCVVIVLRLLVAEKITTADIEAVR